VKNWEKEFKKWYALRETLFEHYSRSRVHTRVGVICAEGREKEISHFVSLTPLEELTNVKVQNKTKHVLIIGYERVCEILPRPLLHS